jgi:hypothetical protein
MKQTELGHARPPLLSPTHWEAGRQHPPRKLFSHTNNLNELDLPKEAEHYGIDRLPDYLAKTPSDEIPGDRFW